MTTQAEMMQPNDQTIELFDPEEYKKKHPKKEPSYGGYGGYGGYTDPANWKGRYRNDKDDDICTLYD